MLPVVALVGRPNVGKSTLFNVLTRTRDALVADQPGLTRDRHYGICHHGSRPFVVVDTGGLSGEDEGIDVLMARQVQLAIGEATIVVFVTDARAGLMAQDREILGDLRKRGKPFVVAVNKTDGLDEHASLADFAALGVDRLVPLAASHGRGVDGLMNAIEPHLPDEAPEEVPATEEGIRVAIVGRPNVGKSTLVNRLLGEDRVVVSDIAGTTRDSIRVPIERDGKRYTLIDTAGVRRRARVEEAIEKFSIIKTLQSIAAAQVVILLLDASEGVSEQDATLIGHVLNESRALVVVANKWDNLTKYQREQCEVSLERRLDFVQWAERIFISAKHGSGLRELMKAVDRAYASAIKKFSSSELNRALETAYQSYQPPLVRGHAPKLRYAHPGGTNPPTVVIHGSRTKHLADSYKRYLENFFRKRFKLVGTPLRLEFRDGENPFAGRKNELTDSQQRKRQRMIRRAKKQ
ncbi:ribosome biogenesis GTPase Der [Tahibacter amnicola]|uniref:GTPase Der n=1 Tax=Tahibacter amnicola TaxID=2976241 RepID=A0ABY6B961_9GAMM|nr:ribosome biogenesis GTPase Der [Tahibacter amnicola]UXI66603.1 ribosome biogenesis GTPase Der [Tahibacter amnicola]